MLQKLIDYFDIGLYSGYSLGPRAKNRTHIIKKWIWTFIYYAFVVLGVMGNVYITTKTITNVWPVRLILISCIVGAVIYPKLVEKAKIKTNEPNSMQIFVCFQNGFFWPSFLKALSQVTVIFN
ncbi:MAG: hypothetical protein KC550_03010 [Nanoarchaeota archaeon]|nr:hypothetical protein [Nanoarchaeota archaeon]